MSIITASCIMICSDIDKNGMWEYEMDGVKKKLTRVKILITDKESKTGKNAYIIQQLGKVKDDEGNEVLDTDTGKPKYAEKFIASGKKNIYKKKEKNFCNLQKSW